PIQPAPVRERLEHVRQADNGLRRAEHQEAVRFHRPGETAKDIDLCLLIEKNQNVPAENDVEGAELGEIVQQIQLPVLNHRADVRVDLPEFAVLLEIFDQQLNRKAALDLELAVDAVLRFLHAFRGRVC